MGEKGLFCENTTGEYPSFTYIEDEVERGENVVLCLGFYEPDGTRVGGHFVTVAGVNSTTSQLLISNPIRDESTPPLNWTIHNNASLVSHDAYIVAFNPAKGYWTLAGYFLGGAEEARIEYAVITSPTAWWVHDVAITNVVPSKTALGHGYTTPINVTAKNPGDYTESFNVTVYANSKIIHTLSTNITLTIFGSKTITFTWNTTGFARGNYTINAYASPVPGETNLKNNNFTYGTVQITKVGDLGAGVPPQFFKFDGVVDGKDFALFLECYHGTAPPDAMYLGDLGSGVPPTFFKCDGKVDGKDFALFLECYHGTGP
jgi:hypothetical protein